MPEPKRILVVDDEPGIRQATAMLLSFDGHQVQTAGSGEEALQKYEPGFFDLVVTDYSMPGMKGDELALALKKQTPAVPILLLTAFPPHLQPAGIDMVMTKPFDLASLREGLVKLFAL